jgi:phospholipid transport system substrate-binding protein
MSQRWKTFERRHPLWTFIMAMLIAMSFSRPALAADPQARVREILEAVSTVMHDPQLQGSEKEGERKQRVRQIIFDTFDFDEMARMALGSHWAGLTSAQRTEFVGLFGDVFERSYTRLVLRFLPERETTYGAETIAQQRAVVKTTLVVKKTNEQLPVDYRLLEKDQRWRVYDVVVDGISLAQNYRAQFDRIIRSSSYDTLVQKIKAQLAQASS